MNAHIELEKPEPDNPPERRISDTVAAVAGLRWRDCKWPIGEPDKPGFRFCGCRTSAGEVYCSKHLKRSFNRAVDCTKTRQRMRGRLEAALAFEASLRPADLQPPEPIKVKPSRPRRKGPVAQFANGGLQRQIFAVLRVHRPGEPLPAPAEMAKLLGIKPEAVRGQLSRYVAKGWIRRDPFKLIVDPFADEVRN